MKPSVQGIRTRTTVMPGSSTVRQFRTFQDAITWPVSSGLKSFSTTGLDPKAIATIQVPKGASVLNLRACAVIDEPETGENDLSFHYWSIRVFLFDEDESSVVKYFVDMEDTTPYFSWAIHNNTFVLSIRPPAETLKPRSNYFISTDVFSSSKPLPSIVVYHDI